MHFMDEKKPTEIVLVLDLFMFKRQSMHLQQLRGMQKYRKIPR